MFVEAQRVAADTYPPGTFPDPVSQLVDEERRAQDEVQKLTDRTIAEIDRLIHGKEAEILAV